MISRAILYMDITYKEEYHGVIKMFRRKFMSMIEVINRIPTQLQKISQNRESLKLKLKAFLKADSGIRRIVIIASGTSYNAAFTTKHFAENINQVPVDIIYPNMFVHYYNHSLLDEKNLYIFISQGGKTKLVYEALQIVKKKKYRTISLTETLDSPIADLADVALEIGSENEEYLYRTLGYSATCATLSWIYISLLDICGKINEEEIDMYKQDYQNMINNLSKIKENTMEWYKKHKFELMQKHNFLFAGTNDLWAVAQEADIKFMEMLPVFTNSFELEELIHGPQNSFNHNIGYFILSRSDEDHEKARSITNFIEKEISSCYLIGDYDEASFNVSPESKYFSNLEYITYFQVLAYMLSTDRGRDLTKGIYPRVVNYINKSM